MGSLFMLSLISILNYWYYFLPIIWMSRPCIPNSNRIQIHLTKRMRIMLRLFRQKLDSKHYEAVLQIRIRIVLGSGIHIKVESEKPDQRQRPGAAEVHNESREGSQLSP
jgi:hypothetical protein